MHSPTFLNICWSLSLKFPVSHEFLTSLSFKLVNPRSHVVATDQVSVRLPAASISGLSDEAVLALFTRGFFGGWVFSLERIFLKAGAWRFVPAGYTGLRSLPTERIEWNQQNMPSSTFIPVGDVLFGSFKLIDSHVKQSLSDPLPSYLDFGFGSDAAWFGGCHRFSLHRIHEVSKAEEVEVRIENFRCNPQRNVRPWQEYIALFHRCYEKLLFTDGIMSILRR